MKKVKVFTKIAEFEDFVNNLNIVIIKVDIMYLFQECFAAVVFYSEEKGC